MSSRKMLKSKHFFEEDFIEAVAEVPIEKIESWSPAKKLKIIGKPVSRIDGYDKVSGAAGYTFDIKLPGMVHAKILRSPYPNARIKSIDTSKAENFKGVLAVISYKNTEPVKWYADSFLFDPHVRYEGEEVACVAAETEAIAGKALRLIKVEYEELPFVIRADDAMKPNAPQLYPEGNILSGKPLIYERGNVANGFNEADIIVEDTFETQVVVHNPTEAHCSVVNWDNDKLTVWDSTQGIFSVRDTIADSLGIPESNVRVIKKYMGGGFGSKLAAGKYSVMAALLAKKIGRPVKIILDRKEMNLAVGNRPDSVQKLRIGVKKNGEITALDHYSYGASGAHPSGAGCAWPLRTIYKCPNVRTEEYSVFINAGPGRPFRAPGHVQGVFGLDSLMDEAAEKLQLDPLDFRLKNYADVDQMANIPYTSKRLKECYLQGAEAIGWNRRKKAGSESGHVKTGIGMASQIWWGGGGPPAYATLKLNRDGSAEVLAGTQDLGTGTYTFIAQVVAEVLEIPMDHISATLGDTATTPYGPSSGGSTTAPSISPAVRDAAEQMKIKLMEAVGAEWAVPVSNLVYEKGGVFRKSQQDVRMTVPDIFRKLRERVLITTGAREANPDGYAINSFGAQFAEVEVDTETGKIRVKKIVAAHDIGRVLNRKLLENQFHGGMMQGLGYALMEERVIDRNTGKILTINLQDYKIPTVTDTPEMEIIIVSDGDSLISNTGVKGIGEPAIIPTAGAIANAVYNAIGVRLKSLPMTPEKVLKALNS